MMALVALVCRLMCMSWIPRVHDPQILWSYHAHSYAVGLLLHCQAHGSVLESLMTDIQGQIFLTNTAVLSCILPDH